ncbi:Ribosomal L1 domain-containing protein 1, partial [Perkinsus olseni]
QSIVLAPMEKSSVKACNSQLPKAVSALLKYSAKKSEEKATKDLLAEEAGDTVTVQINVDKIQGKADNKYRLIQVPHSIHGKNGLEGLSICLIARDPKQTAQKLVAKYSLPIHKIVTIKALRSKYAARFELLRDLANAHDVFLCDSSVADMLPNLLGKYFYHHKKQKIPVPVKWPSSVNVDPTKQVEKALNSTRYRKSTGASISVRIGDTSMSKEDLVENAEVVLAALSSDMLSLKRKILSVGVQSTDSIMLPVWTAKPAAAKSVEEKPEKKGTKRVRFAEAAEEEEEEQEDVGKLKLSEVPVGKLEERREKKRAAVAAEAPRKILKVSEKKGKKKTAPKKKLRTIVSPCPPPPFDSPAMKIKKPSRRQTLNRKYNIQKKVKEHNRKVKKQARVARKSGVVVSKKRRDPGIPNSWPFKQEVLNDMEKRKMEIEANRKRERELRKKGLPVQPVVSKKKQDKIVKSLAELKSEAERRTRLYDRSADALIGSSTSVRDMHSVTHLGSNSKE